MTARSYEAAIYKNDKIRKSPTPNESIVPDLEPQSPPVQPQQTLSDFICAFGLPKLPIRDDDVLNYDSYSQEPT
jgi:hypothetical protein